MDSKTLQLASQDLRCLFSHALSSSQLEISFNWQVSEKTVSEIGGRLIEDFILTKLPQLMNIELTGVKGRFIKCTVPTSQRSMEDIAFTWLCPDNEKTIELLVDVKGHNETKKGSRPNLASIRKCRDFYSNSLDRELWIFFCRYTPIIESKNNMTNIHYRIEDGSFEEKGCFLLRNLSDDNMDPADIGSGGQILFARENNIKLIEREREDMVTFLDSLTEHIATLKASRALKRKA